jgi:hypothetical protein
MSSNRSLLLIGAGVLALAALAVAVVLLSGDRDPVEFPADSPEGALQRYLAAFDDGDLETAYAFFSSGVRAAMALDEWERTVDMFGGGMPDDRVRRAIFDGRSGEGNSVEVRVTIEEIFGEGLTTSTSRYQSQIRMVREADGWRIDEPLVWLEPAPIEPRF